MKNEVSGYPQKYSLMPVIKQVGWTRRPGWECERDMQVVAYVAMECYLLQEVINYNGNGTSAVKYLVVFAKSPEDFSTEVYPGKMIYGVNTTGEYVNYVCDTLEEAMVLERIENDKIVEEAGMYASASERQDLKNDAIKTIAEYVDVAAERRLKPKVSDVVYI